MVTITRSLRITRSQHLGQCDKHKKLVGTHPQFYECPTWQTSYASHYLHNLEHLEEKMQAGLQQRSVNTTTIVGVHTTGYRDVALGVWRATVAGLLSFSGVLFPLCKVALACFIRSCLLNLVNTLLLLLCLVIKCNPNELRCHGHFGLYKNTVSYRWAQGRHT